MGKKLTCKVCHRELAYTEFNKAPENSSGRNTKCKKCESEYARSYYWKNKEKVDAAHRDWYQRNRDKRQKSIKAWAKANKEKCRAFSRINNAFVRSGGGERGTFTDAQWKLLLKDCGYRCVMCKGHRSRLATPHGHNKSPLEVDHVVPLARGGDNNIGNIQPLCQFCNAHKKLRNWDYRPAWIVQKYKLMAMEDVRATQAVLTS